MRTRAMRPRALLACRSPPRGNRCKHGTSPARVAAFWPDGIAQQRKTAPTDDSRLGWSGGLSQVANTGDTLYGSEARMAVGDPSARASGRLVKVGNSWSTPIREKTRSTALLVMTSRTSPPSDR